MTESNKKRSQEKVSANTTFASQSTNYESAKSLRRCDFYSGLKITTSENMLKTHIFPSIYINIYGNICFFLAVRYA